jgi:hypothetical protein
MFVAAVTTSLIDGVVLCGRVDDAAAQSVKNRTTDRSSCSTVGWLDAEVALRPGGRVVEAVHLCELQAPSSWGLEGANSRCQTEKGAWSLHGYLKNTAGNSTD